MTTPNQRVGVEISVISKQMRNRDKCHFTVKYHCLVTISYWTIKVNSIQYVVDKLLPTIYQTYKCTSIKHRMEGQGVIVQSSMLLSRHKIISIHHTLIQ